MIKKIIFTAVLSGSLVLSGCSIKSSITKDNIIENNVISNSTTTTSTTKVLTNNESQEQQYKFIKNYNITVTVGGFVGIENKAYNVDDVVTGQMTPGGVKVRIAPHSARNEGEISNVSYQEFITVPIEYLQLSGLNNAIACTEEAKICPDGSAVGRSGPNCEFAACPVQTQSTSTSISLSSGIQGIITLGPICPVQHMPPDPNCADKPYQATVLVKNADGQEITHFTSAQDGSFKVNLSPGTFLLQPFNNGGTNYPIGRPQQVTVSLNKFTEANLMFDTGIR